MKSTKKFLAVLAVMSIVGFSGLKSYAENVGIIDLDKIGSNYAKAQDFTTDLKVKEAELQKFVADAQKKLKDAASPVERKNLEDKLSNEYKTKSDNFRDLQLKALKDIDDSVFAAIDKVSKTQKLDLILNKSVVIQGGSDITDQVLNILNVSTPSAKTK